MCGPRLIVVYFFLLFIFYIINFSGIWSVLFDIICSCGGRACHRETPRTLRAYYSRMIIRPAPSALAALKTALGWWCPAFAIRMVLSYLLIIVCFVCVCVCVCIYMYDYYNAVSIKTLACACAFVCASANAPR